MNKRFDVLDGWRGISILCVLAAHLLPLGISSWQLNRTFAAVGMALFFILSGFLITNILIRDQNLIHFLIRRIMRIVPLAWLALVLTLCMTRASAHEWASNFFFYANWPPIGLVPPASHFWSLCLEVQFYLLIALLVYTLKDKAFGLLPVLCLLITLHRVLNGIEIAVNTYFRLDEILAGCILALIYHHGHAKMKRLMGHLNVALLLVLLIVSSHPRAGLANYFRPYLAMLLVGATLFSSHTKWWDRWLKHRFLFYVASISYALYVIHGGLRFTWLAEGDTFVRYLKRPLFFLVTFAGAHLSTKYYERYWINLGKKMTSKRSVQDLPLTEDQVVIKKLAVESHLQKAKKQTREPQSPIH